MQKINKFRAHPWHGVTIGPKAPDIVQVYIELVPEDGIKYELDKSSGILKVDRPQRFSSYAPAPYGMIPQTYCGQETAKLMEKEAKENRQISPDQKIIGDDDPLDILVLTEKIVPHGDIMMTAKPIGGLALLDRGEADDKIISVLEDDSVYSEIDDISELPWGILQRIQHYFLSYKKAPDTEDPVCRILTTYGREHARQVIEKSKLDYQNKFQSTIE
ncbi:inorganic pyrophosphatase [Halanaerobiaceae bacterium Z-7014]|uniref:inorganic diphosphatase n=1 Tax=Halonatronomonas betaini TaxID=2778430 RepID=A0A931AN73_9FIRM|nr:inorganic pyrophosphatase [Halonatronomonas betaini]MBF8435817.1 inorganic pyrophosphatase [Halonatronomonas betaini]